MGFYEEYVKRMGNLTDKPDMATPYKNDYLRNIIKNGKVYKFIDFGGDSSLAELKLKTLKERKIWFSFYKTLNDDTEFEIKYNADKVSKATGRSVDNVHLLVNFLTQMYDVYSLSYEYQDYMWDNYAANGNGICIEFTAGNYEYLFPIEYVDKLNVDFDQMVISAINERDMALSIIPWVIKNPYNQSANIDSTKEKEIRILYCPYDNGEVNYGIIQRNIKEQLGYHGIEKPYSDFKLEISKVIIGEKCNKKITDDLREYFTRNNILYLER